MRISDWSSDVCSSDLVLGGVGLTHNSAILFSYKIGIFRQNDGDPPFNLDDVRRHFLEGDGGVGYIGSVNCLNGRCVPHDDLTNIHVCTTSKQVSCETGLAHPGDRKSVV